MGKFKNLIYNNAYGILGLAGDAQSKDITKRYKEIEKLLKIDRIQKYPFDFDLYVSQRNLDNVNIAYKELQLESRKIYHSFFACCSDAIKFPSKDNLIKLTIESFDKKCSIIQIKDVINAWKNYLDKDENIEKFKKEYISVDKIGIDEKVVFNDFKRNLINELMIIFTDISKLYDEADKDNVLKYFISKFNIENNNINISEIDELYEKIYKTINELNKLNISEDGVFDDNEKRILKESIIVFKECFDKLSKLGVYETSKTKIVRDNVAECLYRHSVDLHNNLQEYEEVLNLYKYMLPFAGTEGLKTKLEKEEDVVKKNLRDFKNTSTIDPNQKKSLVNSFNKSIVDLLILQGNLAGLSFHLMAISKNRDQLEYILNYLRDTYKLKWENGRIVRIEDDGCGCLVLVVLVILGFIIFSSM